MSRIISLTSENVMRLKAVHIKPGDANVVLIGGDNGNGKTSVLDSIAMAVGGGDEIPDVPVRRGEEKARIILELDDLVIKRTFTAAGGTQLVVENKEGFRCPKPQEMLDKLTGKLAFDPLEFLLLKPAARLESLKKIVGLDFSVLDAKRKALYDERTLVNRQAEQAKAKAEFMEQFPDAPPEPVDTSKLMDELVCAQTLNKTADKLDEIVKVAKSTLDQHTTKLDACERGIVDLETQIKLLTDRLAASRDNRKTIIDAQAAAESEWLKAQEARRLFQITDEAPLRQALASAAVNNRQVEANRARTAAINDAQAIYAKSEKLTQQIGAIDSEKEALLGEQKFPVPGLSFDDTGVLFNGLPFDQASDAEKLRVSVAMGLAMNPKLRVLLVRNGAWLDKKSLALLTELATEAKAQVWVERVGDGDPAAIIIEDGSVREATPAAADEQAEPAFPSV